MIKYGNKKVNYDGYSFGSKLEASIYAIIKQQEELKKWKLWNVQDHVNLTKANILYIADFKCFDLETKKHFWVEAKGFETSDWRIKRRLWSWYGPGDLLIYKGSHARPFLHETLTPEVSELPEEQGSH
jgi:hypothetical protein